MTENKMQFVLICRDGTDDKALERRMAAREAHLKSFKEGLASNQNILGGALLDTEGTMRGSLVVVEFPDRAALDAWLKTDPYVIGNVWQAIEILPLRLAGKL